MRKKSHMPAEAHYREKWQMALDLIDLAGTDGVPYRAVVADSWYGNVPAFRQGLDHRTVRYVVGIRSDTAVFLEAPIFEELPPTTKRRARPRKHQKLVETNPLPVKVAELGQSIAEGDWEHLEIRKDSLDEPLVIEVVSKRVYPAQGYKQGSRHEEVWLIIERRHSNGARELHCFFSNMPQDMPTIELVRLFHARFWIEQGCQQLKEELGLDHHEGRSWTGWHRHVLLAFLAFGYLTLQRIQEKTHSADNVVQTHGHHSGRALPLSNACIKAWKGRNCPLRSSERWRDR
jgi:SRSO17 transposase